MNRFFYVIVDKDVKNFDKRCNFISYDNEHFCAFIHKESEITQDKKGKPQENIKIYETLALIPYEKIDGIYSSIEE